MSHHYLCRDFCFVLSLGGPHILFGDLLRRAALMKDPGECLTRNEKVLLSIYVGPVVFTMLP